MSNLLTEEKFGLTPAQIDGVMDSIYRRGDLLMKIFIMVHMLIALALAPRYGAWLVTLAVGPAAVLMFLVSVTLMPRSFLTRVVCGIVLQIFVALHIYQFHGLAEMHFFFFTASTMMIVYCDRASMWPGTALIIGQHILFAVLHNSGVKLYFFEDRYVGVTKLSFHFAIVIGQVAICGFWAHLLRNRTLLEFAQRELISKSRQQLAEQLAITQASESALQRTTGELIEKTEILRSVLDNIADAVIVAGRGGPFVVSNPAAKRIFGQWTADVPPEDQPRRLGLFQTDAATLLPVTDLPLLRALDGADVDDVEIFVRAPESARGWWVNVNGRPMRDGRGDVAGAVIVCRDITERKNAEEALRESEKQLRQAQKLEAVGLLAGGIAHDFNNVLTVITGYGNLLLAGLPEGKEARGYAEQILGASGRAAALTGQLLTFSRRNVLQPRSIDINESIGALENMLQTVVGENIEVVLRLDPNLDPVHADPGQIDQVILNLALNARDAMVEGGRLLIRTYPTSIEASPFTPDLTPGRYVVLEVADTGQGMDAEVQSHIFEPFYTTKERGKGTGLGLSIVYGIIRQGGGHISVYSEPRAGATFTILLPLAPEIAAPDQELARDGLAGGSETILLVEDEADLRRMLKTILVNNGYRVIEAVDGEDGLRVGRAHSGPIDLVLTDVVMPRLKGPEMISRLKSLREVRHVLYMSGYVDTSYEYFRREDQSVDFLPKPFGPQALLQRVRECIAGRVEEQVGHAIRPEALT